MAKLMAREAVLVLLTGLLGAVWVPLLLGQGPALRLFWVGLIMALNYAALYSLSVMIGNRMSPTWRGYLGAISWAAAFGNDALLLGALLRASAIVPVRMGWNSVYVMVMPGLVGLVLVAVAAVKAPAGRRLEAALDALYAYSFPMVGVRWLLVSLVSGGRPAGEFPPGVIPPEFLTIHLGVLYLAMRVLVRIFAPTAVEGKPDAGPLVHRPVPDAIVGLVEGTTRRRARPYATREDGSRDEDAISLLCRQVDAANVISQVAAALEGKPFEVSRGVRMDKHVEIVIRPRQ